MRPLIRTSAQAIESCAQILQSLYCPGHFMVHLRLELYEEAEQVSKLLPPGQIKEQSSEFEVADHLIGRRPDRLANILLLLLEDARSRVSLQTSAHDRDELDHLLPRLVR